jgi:hypothetical protein
LLFTFEFFLTKKKEEKKQRNKEKGKSRAGLYQPLFVHLGYSRRRFCSSCTAELLVRRRLDLFADVARGRNPPMPPSPAPSPRLL